MGEQTELNFGQFCRLFQRDPWRGLLPKEVLDQLPQVVLKYTNYHNQCKDQSTPADPPLLHDARQLFNRFDVDSS